MMATAAAARLRQLQLLLGVLLAASTAAPFLLLLPLGGADAFRIPTEGLVVVRRAGGSSSRGCWVRMQLNGPDQEDRRRGVASATATPPRAAQQPPQARPWAPALPSSTKVMTSLLGLVWGLRPLAAPFIPPAYAAAETQQAAASVVAPSASAAAADGQQQKGAIAMEGEDAGDLLDEVWKLTSKFYLDRGFNGNDWAQVRKDLRARVNIKDPSSETATTKRMLKLLGDKYTRLLSPSTYTEMSRFDPIGAGFMLSIDDDGFFTVSSDPREGTEAAARKIEKGDKILEIEGVAVRGKSVFDAVDLITKDDKADVRLTVQSKRDASTRTLVLPRQFDAVANPVKFQLSTLDGGRKLGYVKLREFNSRAKANIQEAIAELEKQGADEYVLDLRGNPGGSVQAAVEVASVFLAGEKVVTYIQDATGQRLPLRTQGEPSLKADPLVVWTDGRSASASEILASALRDNCRAVLMGKKTFGKGLVQGVFGLADGKGLVMTVAKYETPRGASIQGTGIAPDIEAKLPSTLLGDQDVSMVKAGDFQIRDRLCAAAPEAAAPAP